MPNSFSIRIFILTTALVCFSGLSLSQTLGNKFNLPDLGDVSRTDLSVQEEQRLGDEIMQEIRLKESAYMIDAGLTDYLNELGQRLTGALTDERSQRFQFFIMNDPSINAFALPGGYIGVHTGLLLAAQTESELASVLAHEMSHVTQHHIARGVRVQNNSFATVLASVAVAILASRKNPDVAQGALMAGQAGAIEQQLSYSRDFEREADRTGLNLLHRAGFDVRGMESFFERLQRLSRVYENNNVPSYLQTHPLTSERISDINTRIQNIPPMAGTSSEDFTLVQARLHALYDPLPEVLIRFQEALRKNPSDKAARYGWTLTLMRQKRIKEATDQLKEMQKLKYKSPLFLLLSAEVTAQQGPGGSITLLRTAQTTFLNSRALAYALADTLLEKSPDEALRFINTDITQAAKDDTMRLKLAKAYALLGNRFQQHRAQAEAYAIQGLLSQAIEQYNLAQKSPEGTFFDQAQIDVRLRELKQQMHDRKKDRL